MLTGDYKTAEGVTVNIEFATGDAIPAWTTPRAAACNYCVNCRFSPWFLPGNPWQTLEDLFRRSTKSPSC